MTDFSEGQHEEWRQIDEWPYSVSSFGRVRNDRTGKILKADIAKGYCRVSLSANHKFMRIAVHILVCTAFYIKCSNERNGKRPKYIVRHLDRNTLNNIVSNLAR